MKEELKTLKDLEDYEFLKLEEGFMEGHKFKDSEELRAEAKNWTDPESDWKDFIEWAEKKTGLPQYKIKTCDFLTLWIEYFFNLEEEFKSG